MAIKELVRIIARSLVDEPEGVDVSEVEAEQHSVVELRVARPDIGKVIGKDGKTAQSIRTVINAAAAKLGKRVQLDIVE